MQSTVNRVGSLGRPFSAERLPMDSPKRFWSLNPADRSN
jgi:hypothetical protein